MTAQVGEHAPEYRTRFGNVSAASVGAIQRALASLGDQGGQPFSANRRWISTTCSRPTPRAAASSTSCARGAARSPKVYAVMLVASGRTVRTPAEVGDPDKPNSFFF